MREREGITLMASCPQVVDGPKLHPKGPNGIFPADFRQLFGKISRQASKYITLPDQRLLWIF